MSAEITSSIGSSFARWTVICQARCCMMSWPVPACASALAVRRSLSPTEVM